MSTWIQSIQTYPLQKKIRRHPSSNSFGFLWKLCTASPLLEGCHKRVHPWFFRSKPKNHIGCLPHSLYQLCIPWNMFIHIKRCIHVISIGRQSSALNPIFPGETHQRAVRSRTLSAELCPRHFPRCSPTGWVRRPSASQVWHEGHKHWTRGGDSDRIPKLWYIYTYYVYVKSCLIIIDYYCSYYCYHCREIYHHHHMLSSIYRDNHHIYRERENHMCVCVYIYMCMHVRVDAIHSSAT